ncbi:hypothetical protein AT1G40086 [Arabidopsis thaliana]|uniref:Uncharacterized protein n=1 Tax=Arabidopsis thaliana TaxID=3702 RepID=A0A1P8APU8_ARATH|nr:uncharacterized protein AT1G40086 [Arabidopsis thaliana]ANM58677.1 hypothetical protein AT1G40086 [Arabidopsis thaliana]|eukprot:NP_001321093.1 hypothetical protein AT1G40086 [Arabidopsis thaliana]
MRRETLRKSFTASKQFFVGLSLFWEKIGPLLGENGYQYYLNTPNPSLTLIISQMHWIVTKYWIVIPFDHINTKKASFGRNWLLWGVNGLFWPKMGISVV